MNDLGRPVRLAGGRTVALHELSSPGSRTVVLCHAAPGAGSFDPDPVATAGRAVHLVAVDRPGYGMSEPVADGEWSSVAQAADDLAEVLRGRGIERVGVAGWSAGGRVALGLAARHLDLVERVAVIATPAPDESVPWIPDEQRAGLESLRGAPADVVHAALGEMLAGLVPADPATPSAVALIGAGPADEPALDREGVRGRLTDMLAVAFVQGGAGMTADIAGYCLQPWGFEPGEVRQKALLIFGAADPIGSAHGRWWQKALPNARLEMVPDAGHLVIVPMWKRILSFLAPGR